MATSPQFVAGPFAAITTFVNADSTNTKTLYTAPTGGCRIDKFFITSDDTTSRAMTISLSDGTNTVVLDRIMLRPSTTVRPVVNWNVLDPNRLTMLNLVDPALILPVGMQVIVNMGSAVTSAKTVWVMLMGGTF